VGIEKVTARKYPICNISGKTMIIGITVAQKTWSPECRHDKNLVPVKKPQFTFDEPYVSSHGSLRSRILAPA
jgi:hypothetical protein